ncbi:MFS transporter SP family sugar:H+ symporter [Microdochium nivale]|nr:MFS transporter SP family sugar:H+ symporter [Microdochium nivale]
MVPCAWMQAMNQISGINVTSYYITYVFIHAIGLNELLARILAAAGSVDYLAFSSLAYFVIERYGRRKVMMVSAAACSLCWTVIAIALGLSESGRGDPYTLGIVAVSFFFAFFACFAMGVLGIPWLYPTEVGALAFRSQGASLAMATNWICNYMVAQITPPGIENLGYRFWIIWAVLCASFVPTTYLFYPETANRTLEDIDRFFADNRGVLVFRNKLATQLQRPSIYEEADSEVAHQTEAKQMRVTSGEKLHPMAFHRS